jgi:peptidyl-prolyl isomerase G (cyclophilin G)
MGMQHVEAIAKLPTDPKDRPLQPVIIAHCGELERRKPAPVRPRSESRSVSPSGSSSASSEPRHKKRKHKSDEDKAAKRARKEAKRARKEEKRAKKKLKKQQAELEAQDEPGPEDAETVRRRQEEEDIARREKERLEAREDEYRRRELERIKEQLGDGGKNGSSVTCECSSRLLHPSHCLLNRSRSRTDAISRPRNRLRLRHARMVMCKSTAI